MKIAIIGDGVIGYSIAAELAFYEDIQVTMFMDRQIDYTLSATTAAAAMLNVFSEVDKYTFYSKETTERFNLAVMAKEMWPSWASYYKIPVNFCDTYVRVTHFIDNNNINFISDALKKYPGNGTVEYSAAWDRNLIKLNEGCLRPLSLLESLCDAFLENTNSKIQLFEEFDEKKFDKVIYCAGAKTGELLNMKVKMYYGNGLGMHIDGEHNIKDVYRTPVRTGVCGVVIVPQTPTKLYIGASNKADTKEASLNNPEHHDTAYFLLKEASFLITSSIDISNCRYVLGSRPLTEDGLPLIGQYDDKTYVCTGTRRDGLTMSPILAKDMVARVLDVGSTYVPDIFSPLREPIRWLSKDEAILDTTDMLHNNALLHEQQIKTFDTEVKKKYNDLKINYGILPELYHLL